MTLLRGVRYLLAAVPRSQILLLFGLMLLAAATEGAGILLLVPLLGLLEGGAKPQEGQHALLAGLNDFGIPLELGALLGLFVGLVVLRGMIQYGRDQLGARVQHQVVDGLRQQCFSALLKAEWRWLVMTRNSDHADFLLADVSRVGLGLNQGLALLVSSVTIFAHLLVAITLSWSMTLLAVLGGGACFYVLVGQRRQALQLGQQLTRASRALHGDVQESLAGLKMTKILGAEQRQIDRFSLRTQHLRTQQLAFAASNSLSKAGFQIGGAFMLSVYVYVGIRVWQLPMAALLAMVLILGRLIPLLIAGQQQLHHCLHALPALNELRRLLADCHRVAEPYPSATPRESRILRGIFFHDVSVRYLDRKEPALLNVTLTIRPCTTTVILGESGAGKSTLADVLMGLLVPDQGAMKVDDVLISGESRLAWRSQVAYVPQDVFLFHDSIRQNLLWAHPTATDGELRDVLCRASAAFVFDLPNGLDTVIGDGGIRLSGGERQRIALARALLQKPYLLILDEATSALDCENEASIYQAIGELHGDLTIIVIGHRISDLLRVDQVVTLTSGRLQQNQDSASS